MQAHEVMHRFFGKAILSKHCIVIGVTFSEARRGAHEQPKQR
jgi:hypothetical protein